jgi:glycosyltransferase involved in cell wall biosynthesis
MPTLSIVIPLYNKRSHIRRAIESACQQDVKDLEVVVVDDGSTDNGAEIVEEMAKQDDRIRLIRQANAGVSVARNNGAQAARSELIGFLDGDDVLTDIHSKIIMSLVQAYPHAVAYAMNYARVDANGHHWTCVNNVGERPFQLTPNNYFRIGFAGTPIHASGVVIRKQALLEAGGFPPGVRLGEDIDTWLRLIFLGPIAYDPRVGSLYHLDAENRACVNHAPPLHHVFFDTIDRWVQTTQPPDNVREDAREFKNFFMLAHAHHQVRWGDPREGRSVLRNCHTTQFRRWKFSLWLKSWLPRSVYASLAKS